MYLKRHTFFLNLVSTLKNALCTLFTWLAHSSHSNWLALIKLLFKCNSKSDTSFVDYIPNNCPQTNHKYISIHLREEKMFNYCLRTCTCNGYTRLKIQSSPLTLMVSAYSTATFIYLNCAYSGEQRFVSPSWQSDLFFLCLSYSFLLRFPSLASFFPDLSHLLVLFASIDMHGNPAFAASRVTRSFCREGLEQMLIQ